MNIGILYSSFIPVTKEREERKIAVLFLAREYEASKNPKFSE